MTGNDQVDDLARRVMADVIVGIVTNTMPRTQAIKTIDEFAESIKGRVPDDERLEVKTTLLGYVFDLCKIREEQGRDEAPEERLERMAKDCREDPGNEEKLDRFVKEGIAQGHVATVTSVIERDETQEELESRLWSQLAPYFPANFSDQTPEGWWRRFNVGFLIGYGGGRLGAKLLRWLWRLP